MVIRVVVFCSLLGLVAGCSGRDAAPASGDAGDNKGDNGGDGDGDGDWGDDEFPRDGGQSGEADANPGAIDAGPATTDGGPATSDAGPITSDAGPSEPPTDDCGGTCADDEVCLNIDGVGFCVGVGTDDPCAAQDVHGRPLPGGMGTCHGAFGYYWLGTECGFVFGCGCDGSDCSNNFPSQAACEAAYSSCIAPPVTIPEACDNAGNDCAAGYSCLYDACTSSIPPHCWGTCVASS